jgi:hypothetical protein
MPAVSTPSAQSAARASNLGRGLEILLALGSDESMASGGLA